MDSSNGTLLNGAPVKSAVLSGNERIRIGDTEMSFFPVDPIRAKTTVGLTDKPRLSAIIAKRGQSAIQRLRIEKKLRNLTIVAGSALAAILVVVVLLVTGVLGGGGGANVAEVVDARRPGDRLRQGEHELHRQRLGARRRPGPDRHQRPRRQRRPELPGRRRRQAAPGDGRRRRALRRPRGAEGRRRPTASRRCRSARSPTSRRATTSSRSATRRARRRTRS